METQDAAVSQECKKEVDEEPAEEIVDGETISKIKRRRPSQRCLHIRFRLSGHVLRLSGYRQKRTSKPAFLLRFFRAFHSATEAGCFGKPFGIKSQLGTRTCCDSGPSFLLCATWRVSDRMFVGDSAFLLWMIEGNSTIRVHSGFCYIYNDDGAFLPYSGTPPEALLSRVSLFCAIMERVLEKTASFYVTGPV